MTDLKRSLRMFDGLAMVVGIVVGAALAQPRLALMAAAVLVGTWALSWTVKG